jgi:malate dehydrogenase
MTTDAEVRSIAVIGATGACGRQLVAQLLNRNVIDPDSRLQLVGRRGGASANELFGLRVDLRDAFADRAPTVELVDDPAAVDADLVVMIAGATIPTDPKANVDRALLAATNRAMFEQYADELASRPGEPPLVIVQSNPVELGVAVFAERLDRHRVVGAGAWSDTMRFRREIADDLGVRRTAVRAAMIGQHGDHAVPVWSRITVDGIDPAALDAWVAAQRRDRDLADLPAELTASRTRLLAMVAAGDVAGAFDAVGDLPADLRALIKPFLVHVTAGHTTEIVTAHSVVDLVEAAIAGDDVQRPLQVRLDGEVDGLHGVLGLPVRFGPDGWQWVAPPVIADDETAALWAAAAAIAAANDLAG